METLKGVQIAKITLKKCKVGGLTFSDFKTQYKATVTKGCVTSIKTQRPKDCSRQLTNKPSVYSHKISDKGAEPHSGERIVSLTNGVGKTAHPLAKE